MEKISSCLLLAGRYKWKLPSSRRAELCVSSAYCLVLRWEPVCQLSPPNVQTCSEAHTSPVISPYSRSLQLEERHSSEHISISSTPLIKPKCSFSSKASTKSPVIKPFLLQDCKEGVTHHVLQIWEHSGLTWLRTERQFQFLFLFFFVWRESGCFSRAGCPSVHFVSMFFTDAGTDTRHIIIVYN